MTDKQQEEIKEIILALKNKNNDLTMKLDETLNQTQDLMKKTIIINEQKKKLEEEKINKEKNKKRKNVAFNIIFYVIVAIFLFLEFYIFIL